MRTHLYPAHVALKAKIVDFHGWDMPIHYSGIMEEHAAVRERAGLFDLSHMGRIVVTGLGYERWLDTKITAPVARMTPGQVKYGFVLNDQGGIIDDILAYKFKKKILLVVNASNREAVLKAFQGAPPTTIIEDQTMNKAMIAVQGPKALEFIKTAWGQDFSEIKYYHARIVKVNDAGYTISRTGYTGEDGFEIIGSNDAIMDLFKKFIVEGRKAGVIPCGLGARDTLRLEAGMPLYGNELSAEITPIEAGLEFAVPMGKIFTGREAVLKLQTSGGARRKLVGFKLDTKRVARHGFQIFQADHPVGIVTSGTFSPSLNASLGMAYVETALAKPGTELEVDVRGKREKLAVAELPFVNHTRPKR